MSLGRQRGFEGLTTKVSMVLPSETAHLMRVMAAEKGVSVAQLVDDMVNRAKLLGAVELGRRAVAEGNVVTHEEVGRRLKKRCTR